MCRVAAPPPHSDRHKKMDLRALITVLKNFSEDIDGATRLVQALSVFVAICVIAYLVM